MKTYHGTSPSAASNIAAGNINVGIGGGELGKGFYTGEYLHEAKTWAFHKTNSRKDNVVELDSEDNEVEKLEIRIMDNSAAGLYRYRIRRNDETRTYTFGFDLVWAPIVGSDRACGEQYKWESLKSQNLLNGPKCAKVII